jgi:hypothetical protein
VWQPNYDKKFFKLKQTGQVSVSVVSREDIGETEIHVELPVFDPQSGVKLSEIRKEIYFESSLNKKKAEIEEELLIINDLLKAIK